MANEIRAATTPGSTLYSFILNSDGQFWNGATFEDYAAANYSTYDVSMTEQGSSGIYMADFPSVIAAADTYEYIVYVQAGGAPAEGDSIINTGTINWTGSGVAPAVSNGTKTGSAFRDYVVNIFKRDDKDADLYEAVTDTIEEMRRLFGFDRDETEASTTDTISVLGDYRLSLESDYGELVSLRVLDSTTGYELEQISKQEYDRRYPNQTASNVSKGLPEDFCIYGGQIYLGPVPDRVDYTYKASYLANARAEITSATASVPFSDIQHRVGLRYGTLKHLYAGIEEDIQASKYGLLFENWIQQITGKQNKNKSGVRRQKFTDL